MGPTGTLNGQTILRGTVTFPRCGLWTADLELGAGDPLSGAASIALLDLALSGTILQGGPYAGRARYRIVGGAGGWSKPIPADSYRSAAGVKASTVIGDAARLAGETMAAFTDFRVGGWWTRPADEAARVLDELSPEAWYVDEQGQTHIGVRPSSTWSTKHRVLDARVDRGWLVIGSEALAGLVPGAQLEGIEVGTVRHDLSDKRLQSTIWIKDGSDDRLVGELHKLIDTRTRSTFFHGLYQFRVRGGSGGYLDLRPAKKSLGLPDMKNVPVFVGAYGARGTPQNDSLALVGFINGDPSLPFVHHFGGEWDENSVPTESDIFASAMKLGDSSATKLAMGDAFVALWGVLKTNAAAIDANCGTSLSAFFTTGPHANDKLETTIVEGT